MGYETSPTPKISKNDWGKQISFKIMDTQTPTTIDNDRGQVPINRPE